MIKFERETRHWLYHHKTKQQQLTWCSIHLHRYDVLTVPLTVLLNYPITNMTCTLSYYYSNRAGDNQSCLRILLQF